MKIIGIIATKNRFKYFERALKSAITQKRRLDELIVVSDSEADMKEIERQLAESASAIFLDDEREHNYAGSLNTAIHFILTKELFGLTDSEQMYVAFLDDDDVWEDEYILACEKALIDEDFVVSGIGMMERNGQARFLSWKDFLYSVVDRMPERERTENRCRIEVIPKITESSFVFTDCNMANFVFNMGRLEKAIDIERPLWGDPLFLNGMIKSRNPYIYAFMNQEENSDIVDLYAQLYPYIFNATGKV